MPGHGDGAAACAEAGVATRRLRVAWAVLDGAKSWCWLLLAATGGSATAEAAGVGEARCHRHLRPSKSVSVLWIRRRSRVQRARACTGEIDDKSLKKTTLTVELQL